MTKGRPFRLNRNTTGKSMAARTSEKKGSNPDAKTKSKKRRIRRTNIHLPDEILEHMFSFLPIKTLAQTIILSKHWHHLSLWRSHPHLDIYLPSSHPRNKYERILKLTKLLCNVLDHRQKDSNITTFRLFGRVSPTGLDDCIDRVMSHGIEQLELDLHLESSFYLPKCLFNSSTLRVLTLNEQHKRPDYLVISYKDFNYPTSGSLFPSVHTLSLTNVSFAAGSELFLGCNFPLLRKLCFKNCEGIHNLNINCPGLEILKLDGLALSGLDISGIELLELQVTWCLRYDSGSAKIFAPSLRRLYWEKNNVNPVCVRDTFECLSSGFVDYLSKCPNPAILQNATTFIYALHFVRSLSVGSLVLEVLSSIDTEGGLPFSFNNLKTLELHSDLTKDEVAGIICFLRKSPILHTITIGVNCSKTGNESWDDNRYWRSQSRNLKSMEHHLKVARIDVADTRMSKSAIDLVNFLLMSEATLQEMTLILKSNPLDPSLVRQRIRTKVMKLAPPSSNVRISVLPKD